MSRETLGKKSQLTTDPSWLKSIWSNKTAYFSLFAGSCSLIGLQAIETSAKDKDSQPSKPKARLVSAKDFKCKPQSMADRLIKANQTKDLTALPNISQLLNGGTDCSNRTVIPGGTLFNDTGTTVGGNNTVTSVQAGCSNYTTNAGPDVIYEINLPPLASRTVTNSSITLTPSTAWDPSIYNLSTAGIGCPAGPAAAATNCVSGEDSGGAGAPETISDAELDAMPAGMYFLFVDSFYSTGGLSSGAFSLAVNVDIVGTAPTTFPRSDFDGDGKTDLSVFQPSTGVWYLNRSTAGNAGVTWGVSSDVITPGDFDGDNKTDEAVFRASATPGVTDFYILKSTNGTFQGAEWGTTGDLPAVADYDGDNKDDVAVYRPSTNDYFVIQSSNSAARHYRWGTAGDLPVPGDFDGDLKADFAVFRPSTGVWYYANSSNGAFVAVQWGTSGDMPVFANYDGDTKDDIAVFRPSTGFWYLNRSTAGSQAVQWGQSGDIPVPGDYDGDGKYDTAVFRAGTWYLNRTTAGATAAAFGAATDRPTPRYWLP